MKSVPVRILFGYKVARTLFLLLVAFSLYGTLTRHLPRPVREVFDQWFVGFEREFYGNLVAVLRGWIRGLPGWLLQGAFWAALVSGLQAFGLWRRVPALVWLVAVDAVFFLSLGLFGLTRRVDIAGLVGVALHGVIAWYVIRHRNVVLSGGGGGGGAVKKPRKDKGE